MTIRLNSSNIQIGRLFLEESASGLTFNGIAISNGFFSTDTPLQGTVQGFTSGGSTAPTTLSNVVDKFPFAAATVNATDAGDLSQARQYIGAGQSSTTHGYTSGGRLNPPGNQSQTTIDRFPFTSFTTATSVGSLTVARGRAGGHSSQTNGYTSGGETSPGPNSNVIDKFPFAVATATVTDVGDLTVSVYDSVGISSSSNGYNIGGGGTPTGQPTKIDKFSFSYDGNAVKTGDLDSNYIDTAGVSSKTFGYSIDANPALTTGVQKFPFANDSNSVLVGSLSFARSSHTGISSSTHGYGSGGYTGSYINVIDRFPFAADGAASDVGDLSVARANPAGQQD